MLSILTCNWMGRKMLFSFDVDENCFLSVEWNKHFPQIKFGKWCVEREVFTITASLGRKSTAKNPRKTNEKQNRLPSPRQSNRNILRQYVLITESCARTENTKEIPSLYLSGNVPRIKKIQKSVLAWNHFWNQRRTEQEKNIRARQIKTSRKHPESECCTNAECFCVHSMLNASSHLSWSFPQSEEIVENIKTKTENEKYANDGLELLAFNIAFKIAEQ